MSDCSSDTYPGLNFSDFTAEDFAELDATITSMFSPKLDDIEDVGEASFQSDIDGLNLSLLTPQQLQALDGSSDRHNGNIDVRSDDFDLNLGALTAEELAELDQNIENRMSRGEGGPAVRVKVEDEISGTAHQSPLEEFRSCMSLSVTDLVSPAWYVELWFIV